MTSAAAGREQDRTSTASVEFQPNHGLAPRPTPGLGLSATGRPRVVSSADPGRPQRRPPRTLFERAATAMIVSGLTTNVAASVKAAAYVSGS